MGITLTMKSMEKDVIKLVKFNGEEYQNLKASVQSDKIFMCHQGVLVEPNDLIQRALSNGSFETYKVYDPCFKEKSAGGGIPSHYQMRVKKLGLPEADNELRSIVYNVTGNNARINNNSTDNSTNIVNVNPEIKEQLSRLRNEIDKISSASEKKEAEEVVNAIEAQLASSTPKKSVVSALVNALPNVGSVASIGSFLLSLISG